MNLEGFGFARQDDDDDLGSEHSVLGFAELELKEAQKASRGLLDLYDKLFNHGSPSSAVAAKPPTPPAAAAGMRRYAEGVGYDANYETLDVKELNQWRTNFSYINVTGQRLPTPPPPPPQKGATAEEMLLYGSGNWGGGGNSGGGVTVSGPTTAHISAENNGDYWDSMSEMQAGWRSRVREEEKEDEELCIIGIACRQKRQCCTERSSSNNNINSGISDSNAEEEILAIDGCLEEVFEIDCVSPSMLLFPGGNTQKETATATAIDEIDAIEPEAVHRKEIVSSFLDVLWSDIAVATAPLVEQVATIADSLPDIDYAALAAAAVPQERAQYAFYDDNGTNGEMMRSGSGSENSFGGW